MEEAPPCHIINNDPSPSLSPVAKGKRTKRLRPNSPTVTRPDAADSTTTSEEEDTARCLLLLAQGYFTDNHDFKTVNRSRGVAAVYACKTCDRVFTSFQALGGHRTSHKKPKIEKKTSLFFDFNDEDFSSPSKKRVPQHSLSLQLSSSFAAERTYVPSAPRVHECSYCEAEFTSGQALGGHMRRHRPIPISPVLGRTSAKPGPNNPRNRLSLDLNFPAAPDNENPKFEFRIGRPEKIVGPTNTPALVDCHF
ncbi:hypothetical protein ACS0TY_009437 [Phlomoides rotata]